MKPLTLDLLRHGACADGAIYRGRTDSPLSEAGWAALQRTVTAEGEWQRILSSPAQRCWRFAEWLSQARRLPLEVIDDLREYDFGDWDGCEIAEVWQREPERVRAFWEAPDRHPPPGAEPFAAFDGRLQRLLASLHRDQPGATLLIVTHGGVIRQLLAACLEIPVGRSLSLQLDYASLTRVSFYPQAASGPVPQVEFINRVPPGTA